MKKISEVFYENKYHIFVEYCHLNNMRDMSELADFDFELLKDDCVKRIVLAGKYVHDLKSRFEYADIEKEKIVAFKNLDDMMRDVKTNSVGNIYVVTCFSDRMKFMDRR